MGAKRPKSPPVPLEDIKIMLWYCGPLTYRELAEKLDASYGQVRNTITRHPEEFEVVSDARDGVRRKIYFK